MTLKFTREEAAQKIFVALDVSNFEAVTGIVSTLAGRTRFKAGLQLGTALGWYAVAKALEQRDAGSWFADTKFHDIPNTVEQASFEIAQFPGVGVFNVHAAGGPEMIAAARQGSEQGALKVSRSRPKLLAVTWLTSLNQGHLEKQGIGGTVLDHVLRLAEMALTAGADGLVCSTVEVAPLRQKFPEALLVPAGIRLPTSDTHDQQRVGTPGGAIKAGATNIVIGRELNDPKMSPAQRLEKLNRITDNMLTQ